MSNTDHDLWAAVRDQGKAIIALEANQEAVRDSLKGIINNLSTLTEKVQQAGHTQWQVIFGAIGIVFTLMLLFGGVIAYAWIGDIADVEKLVDVGSVDISKRFDSLTDTVNHHIQEDGHPKAVIKQLEALKEQVVISDQRQNERIDRMQDKIDYLQRRTGTLFKGGEPY